MDFKEFVSIFHKSLKKEFEDNQEKFSDIYSFNCREYTKIIDKIMEDTITKQIGEEYFPEFYKIDHTWWNTKKCENIDRVHIYDWDMTCAIEHENDSYDWTYELAKLDFIRAPLKIVIGYVENDNRANEKEYIKTQMQTLKYLNSEEEFGIILLNKRLTEDEDPFGLKDYLLKDLLNA